MKIGNWTITEYLQDTHIGVRVSDGWHVEYPIRYWNGEVCWDYPEIVPKSVKRAAANMLHNINKRLTEV